MQDNSQHRAECLAALSELAKCWTESSAEDRALIVDILLLIVGSNQVANGDSPPPPPPTTTGGPPYVGNQTAANADFYPLRLWSNLMHTSGPWRLANGGRALVPTDALGNPLDAAMCSIKTSDFDIPTGTYELTYDGGSVSLVGDVTQQADGSYLLGAGAVSATTDGLARNIKLTNTDGGKWLTETISGLVGNCAVFRSYGLMNVGEGGEITQTEMDELWSKLSMMGINIPADEQTVETFLLYNYTRWEPKWEERTTPDHTRWSTRTGLPIEEFFSLCSVLGTTLPWVNVPLLGDSQSDTDYAYQMGALCGVEWSGPMIVEVGNEWWNRGFPFYNMALARGGTLAEGAAAIQTETFEAFKQGFISAGRDASDLRWAVMGWLYDLQFGQDLATALADNPPYYFGASFYLASGKAQAKWKADASADPTLSTYTPRTILDDVEATSGEAFAAGIQGYADLARSIGAKPASYEGNISVILGNLASGVPALNSLVIQAHDDPYAEDLFRWMLSTQIDAGYEVICAFALSHSTASAKDGVFGLWKDATTPRPAWAALTDFT